MLEAPLLTGRPVTMASRGMVSAPHYLAAEAGVWALQQGGNAVDAAIAAAAVLAVVAPPIAGLGGDAFLMVYQPGHSQPFCLNGSGASASQATIQFYRERGYDSVPAHGLLAAATVPGAVAAWGSAHSRWGALPWEQLFEPAIHYAQNGFPVSAYLAGKLADSQPLLERSEGAAALFLHDGRPYAEGETLVQPALARSLESLASDGCEAFYTGDLAAAMVDDLEARGGILTREDFANHHSDWVGSLRSTYRQRTLYELPPNTLGATALLAMNILDGSELATLGDQSPAYYHRLVEATKLALADSGPLLGDPTFAAMPLAEMLSPAYASRRRALVASHARPLSDYASELWAQACPPGALAMSATAGVAAADARGLAVALVQSLHGDLGSGVVAGDTGIVLQNSIASFSLDPASPNRLEPGKRPTRGLMPAMLFEGEQPWLILATAGAGADPQLHAALLTRLLDLGHNIQQAIEAPRWRYEPAGSGLGTLSIEGRVPDSVLRGLRELGHDVKVVGDWSELMGQAQGVVIDREHGILAGGADPRGDGQAIGW